MKRRKENVSAWNAAYLAELRESGGNAVARKDPPRVPEDDT